MTVSNESRPAAVYRLYDAAGTLLYIGSAYDPDHRCNEHRSKPWWPEVTRRSEEWFNHRATAYREELKAIAKEDPKHNVMGSRYARRTEAMRLRDATNRERGRVHAESWEIRHRVAKQRRAEGASYIEARDEAAAAQFAYVEASGLFPAWIERRREHGTL